MKRSRSAMLGFLALSLFACSSPATGAAPSEVSDSFYARVIEAGCERDQACEPEAFAKAYASPAACAAALEGKVSAADLGLSPTPTCSSEAEDACIAAFETLECAPLLSGAVTRPAACGGC